MRLPYGIYKAAQAEALRQKQERAIEQASALSANATQNLAIAREAIVDKYSMRKRLRPSSFSAYDSQATQMEGQGLYGRGAYGVRKFARDFKLLVPRSLREAAVSSALQGMSNLSTGAAMSGTGLYGRGAYNGLIEGGRPSMDIQGHMDETQTITISHCEYLQDVYGAPSAQFFIESWAINPGLSENFPWLAQIAANYEEYELIQLVYHFKSTVDPSATNNTNGATGTIIMATNYNPTAPIFTTKETMMQYHGANSGRVTDDHSHGVECDPEKNAGSAQKYVRAAPVVVGQDPKTFDLGRFQLAQVNLPSTFFNTQIGELWVSYTVRLTKPRLFTGLCGNNLESRFCSAGGETNSGIMGTNPLSMQQNFLNIALSYPAASTVLLTFPDFVTGLFEVQLIVEGTGISALTNNFTVGGNVTQWKDVLASSNQGADDSPGWLVQAYTATQLIIIARIFINPVTTTVDNTLSMNPAITATTITQTQIIVRQCNPTLGQTSSSALPLYVNSAGIVTSTIAT